VFLDSFMEESDVMSVCHCLVKWEIKYGVLWRRYRYA